MHYFRDFVALTHQHFVPFFKLMFDKKNGHLPSHQFVASFDSLCLFEKFTRAKLDQCNSHQLGVESKIGGKPPKWMIYNGKPYQNG